MYSLHFSTEFSFFVIIKYGGEKCNGDLSPISSLLKSDSGQLLVGKSGAHEILATTPGTDEERRTFITTKDKKRRHNFFLPLSFDFCFSFVEMIFVLHSADVVRKRELKPLRRSLTIFFRLRDSRKKRDESAIET